MLLTIFISLIVGFALGSVPFGVLLAKAFGMPDPRTIGSGNIGATNMLRTGRKDIAALTLLLDAVKAAIAVMIGGMFGFLGATIALVGAVLGHVYSPWLGFKGGKGVACALGGLLALSPIAGIAACVLWLTVFFSTRISSLSALIALAFAPFLVWWRLGALDALLIAAAIAVIIYRHKENIARLLRAEEPQSRFGKKDDEEDGENSDHV